MNKHLVILSNLLDEVNLLFRMSQSGAEEGNFVVSVKDENGIHHFEIEVSQQNMMK